MKQQRQMDEAGTVAQGKAGTAAPGQADRAASVGRRGVGRLGTGLLAIALALGVATGCAIGGQDEGGKGRGGSAATGPSDAEVTALMKASFREKGLAKLDRLDQSELQAACSKYAVTPMPAELRSRLEKAALEAVRYPADGNYLGDFKRGERIAQSGVGMQFSDNEKTVNGGNCYACHQLSKEELAFGNIGPSLYNYGKLRGNSEPILKYTWARLWNSHSYSACNAMPRYGAAGILGEDQLRDVMALLLDPKSPVNQ